MLRHPPSTWYLSSAPVWGRLHMRLVSSSFGQRLCKTGGLLQTASWSSTSIWKLPGTTRPGVGNALREQHFLVPSCVALLTSGIQCVPQCPGPGLGPGGRCLVVAGMCWRRLGYLRWGYPYLLDQAVMLPVPLGLLVGGQVQQGGSIQLQEW